MFDDPRILDALLVCVVGNKVKLGDLDRVGDVARLWRGGSIGELDDLIVLALRCSYHANRAYLFIQGNLLVHGFASSCQ